MIGNLEGGTQRSKRGRELADALAVELMGWHDDGMNHQYWIDSQNIHHDVHWSPWGNAFACTSLVSDFQAKRIAQRMSVTWLASGGYGVTITLYNGKSVFAHDKNVCMALCEAILKAIRAPEINSWGRFKRWFHKTPLQMWWGCTTGEMEGIKRMRVRV